MSVFNDIINGNGIPNFRWEVVLFHGDFEAETQECCDTYAQALAFKVNHPKHNDIVIELWYQEPGQQPDQVGNENNFFFLQEMLNYFCKGQNIVLSL